MEVKRGRREVGSTERERKREEIIVIRKNER